MKKKILGIIALIIFFFSPLSTAFAQTSNAGFIPGNIWYSKDPFEEGDKIKIYTLIFNPDARQLSGTVFFFDKTTFLGDKNFTVAGKGLQDVSIDWTVTAGDHQISGQIQNAKFLISSNSYQDASLSEVKTTESKRSVSKKVIADTTTNSSTTQANTSSTTGTSTSGFVTNIQNFVTENTPAVVSNTIGTSTNAVENFRENLGTITDNKKEEVKKEVEKIEAKKTASTNTSTTKKDASNVIGKTEASSTNDSALLRPFKYTELFALSLFSNVFNNKYIFYGLIVIVIFIILRLVVRKFF